MISTQTDGSRKDGRTGAGIANRRSKNENPTEFEEFMNIPLQWEMHWEQWQQQTKQK